MAQNSNVDPLETVSNLAIWSGPVTPEPIDGGITNVNFVVEDSGRKYLVRIGDDILIHQVMRFNELAASRAAHAAGLSPGVVHSEPGILVLEFIESKTFTAEDVQDQKNLERILPLIKSCHRDVPEHLKGPVLMFWVFHVVRDYCQTLRASGFDDESTLRELLDKASVLEAAIGPVEIVFGHNDLLPANILDDGSRLWLIDWDYAGFNSPLFDLGGLASNNELSETQENWLLENYYEKPVEAQLWRRYQAMKSASLLRETLWSMVSEKYSDLDFDYAQYTADNRASFERSYTEFLQG